MRNAIQELLEKRTPENNQAITTAINQQLNTAINTISLSTISDNLRLHTTLALASSIHLLEHVDDMGDIHDDGILTKYDLSHVISIIPSLVLQIKNQTHIQNHKAAAYLFSRYTKWNQAHDITLDIDVYKFTIDGLFDALINTRYLNFSPHIPYTLYRLLKIETLQKYNISTSQLNKYASSISAILTLEVLMKDSNFNEQTAGVALWRKKFDAHTINCFDGILRSITETIQNQRKQQSPTSIRSVVFFGDPATRQKTTCHQSAQSTASSPNATTY